MTNPHDKGTEAVERVRQAEPWADNNPGGPAVTIRATDRDALLAAKEGADREVERLTSSIQHDHLVRLKARAEAAEQQCEKLAGEVAALEAGWADDRAGWIATNAELKAEGAKLDVLVEAATEAKMLTGVMLASPFWKDAIEGVEEVVRHADSLLAAALTSSTPIEDGGSMDDAGTVSGPLLAHVGAESPHQYPDGLGSRNTEARRADLQGPPLGLSELDGEALGHGHGAPIARPAAQAQNVGLEGNAALSPARPAPIAPTSGDVGAAEEITDAGRALYGAGFSDGFLDGYLIGKERDSYPDEEEEHEILMLADSENISDGWSANRDAFLAALSASPVQGKDGQS